MYIPFAESLEDERILVLKAFEVGYNARSCGSVDNVSELCKRGLLAFSKRSSSTETIYSRTFLTLILAELNRDSAPVEFRIAAADLANEIVLQGGPNHFELYMKLVADISARKTTGNFGDLRTSPASSLKEQELNWFTRSDDEVTPSCGIPSLGLLPRELDEHSSFLNASMETLLDAITSDQNDADSDRTEVTFDRTRR